MRFLSGLIIVAATLLVVVAVGHARERVYDPRPSMVVVEDIDETIYDVTIPWPFRKRDDYVAYDLDRDGVADDADQCPGTPYGAFVDMFGCPKDFDGDGIYDGIDQCPSTPQGAMVDANGCPGDRDRDGVYDGLDRCPDTPRKAVVDEYGCPIDTDGDGVYDGIDRCPNEAAAIVDDDGCPLSEKAMEFLDTGVFRTQNITFDSGKATLRSESHETLDKVAAFLIDWPELEIEIGGHTDSQGSAAFNEKLSQERAQAVKDYIVKNFGEVESGQYSVKGYGESIPIATNDTAAGRAENRRVEFTVLNKDTLKREVDEMKRRRTYRR